MAKLIDLTGHRFGRLTVLHRDESKAPVRWVCKCECGSICSIRASSWGSTQSCGCFWQESRRANGFKVVDQLVAGNKKRALPPGESCKRNLFARYKLEAKERGLSWSLTAEEFHGLSQKNCHYCEKGPEQRYMAYPKTGWAILYNGIDRVDNAVGYEPGNCVSCCKTYNWWKGAMTVKEFRDHVKNIYQWGEK